MELKELTAKLQEMADEFKPDEEIIEEEGIEEIYDQIGQNLDSLSQEQLISLAKELAYFCGNWMSDDGYSEEEMNEFSEIINQASKL